jgi:hypothetical protein
LKLEKINTTKNLQRGRKEKRKMKGENRIEGKYAT